MLEIFQYDFMIRAFIAGVAIAVLSPLVGTFMVVRKYSLMSDTLSHVALMGVAMGFILQINPLLMAVAVSIVAGIGMEMLRKNNRLSGDSILSLFLSGSLAVAVVLISAGKGFNVNLLSYLFGNISTVSTGDLYLICVLTVVAIGFVIGFYKQLFLVSLDSELAEAQGIKAGAYNLLLVVLAALAVSLAIKIVGALLIGALMVIPVITAIQFRQGFGRSILIAIFVSFISVILGLFLSFYLGWASGGTIVIITIIFFLYSLVVMKR